MKNLFVATFIVLGTIAFSACGGEKAGEEATATDTTTTITGEEAAADAIDSNYTDTTAMVTDTLKK